MYNLPHFKAANQAQVLAFMQAHPFVIICSAGNNSFPVATHIPILLREKEGKLFLQGHVHRKQEHTLSFMQNEHVLVIFNANHTYISATNYNNPNTASTWNYQAVHAKGKIAFKEDKFLYQLLVELTEHFEGNEKSEALVKKMDEAYVANHMKAIIGFEIEVIEVNHIFKLSQNKEAEEQKRIMEKLQQSKHSQDLEMANTMKAFYKN